MSRGWRQCCVLSVKPNGPAYDRLEPYSTCSLTFVFSLTLDGRPASQPACLLARRRPGWPAHSGPEFADCLKKRAKLLAKDRHGINTLRIEWTRLQSVNRQADELPYESIELIDRSAGRSVGRSVSRAENRRVGCISEDRFSIGRRRFEGDNLNAQLHPESE